MTFRQIGAYRTRLLSVEGEGPAVLLLHGFSDSADSFRPVLARLGAAGRRAVALDLPGFGRAGALPRGPILPVYDEFVRDAVDHVGGGAPVVLVGNSMGGMTALRAATADGPPLAAVVALAPGGLGFHPRLRKISDTVEALVPVLRIAYRPPYPPLVVRSVAAVYFHTRLAHRADFGLAWRYGSHFRNMADFRRIGAIGRVLKAEVEAGAVDLARIARPVLLVWGRDDLVCDVAGAEVLLDAVPGARLVVLPACGHLPQIQQPARVAELILSAAGSDLTDRANR